MPSKSPENALQHILENIRLARRFVEGMTFDSFRADTRTLYAVARSIEIISEASRRLPAAIKERNPDIPWKEIAGVGNVYRHDYEDVRDQIVWRTVQNSLEPLRAVVEQELKRLKD